jgi:glycosyltransferase involved in cell wall biosynthesis
MWKGKSVSVVLASYREKNSIREVIDDFFNTGFIDEVIVVDNNAEPGSVEEVQKTRAKLIFEKQQGQGFALRTGMREAQGYYVILCEGDGTFDPSDTEKFLVYGERFPIVFGTRTNTSLVGPDSAMYFLRRMADVAEALLIEILFFSNRLTDVGCTYKMLNRDVVKQLEPHWITGDSHFNTEVELQAVLRKISFVEIPVAFIKRVGVSSVTESFGKSARWGLKLLLFIFYFRLRVRANS